MILRHVLLLLLCLLLVMMVVMMLLVLSPSWTATGHIDARRAAMASSGVVLPSRQMAVTHLAGLG